jgi:hypothetical protein
MAPKVPAGSREATKLGGLEVEGFIGFFEFVGVDKVKAKGLRRKANCERCGVKQR